jgi:hypothetical protein
MRHKFIFVFAVVVIQFITCSIFFRYLFLRNVYSGHFVNLPQVTTIDRFDCNSHSFAQKVI